MSTLYLNFLFSFGSGSMIMDRSDSKIPNYMRESIEEEELLPDYVEDKSKIIMDPKTNESVISTSFD